MEESVQIVSQQSELITVLYTIVKAVVGLAIVVMGRIMWVFHTRIDTGKDVLTAYKEEVGKENVVKEKELSEYKEQIALKLGGIKSDLRSNTESDGHIDKRLDGFEKSIDGLKKQMQELILKLGSFIKK